jgi:hypothetical protein
MTPESPTIREAPGVSVPVILLFVFGFIAFAAIATTLIGLWYFHAGVDLIVAPRPFPDPQLETRNGQDYDSLKAAQQDRARRYAWVDRGQGLIRIPVSRAMQLLSARGQSAFDPPDAPPVSASAKP